MSITQRLENFLSRLEYVRRAGADQYYARCPAHDSKSVKLSVGLGRDKDRIVMKCWTRGCSAKQIMESVGLTENDMWPEDPHRHVTGYRKPKNWVPEDDEFVVRIGLDAPKESMSKKDWERFQDAVKRESRRLDCNALEFYRENAWSRKA